MAFICLTEKNKKKYKGSNKFENIFLLHPELIFLSSLCNKCYSQDWICVFLGSQTTSLPQTAVY